MDHALVRSIPLFAGAKRRQRLELAALADEVTVPAGTPLTREGAYAREFFVIVEGSARVTRRHTSTAHVNPGSAPLATLGPGDFFGEVGLIDGPARSATVIASSPMKLLVSGAQEFSTLMHGFPVIAERIREAFAARVGAPASRRA
jgi:CRP/FNR family cyclic AMP-dependent transcriptional regulator